MTRLRRAASARQARARRVQAAPAVHALTDDERRVVAVIATLFVVTAVIISPSAREAFRLVKTLAAGWLGLLSLLVAAWSLRRIGALRLSHVAGRLTVQAAGPLAMLVLLGALWTTHRAHYAQSATDFLIAVACLIGWSLVLSAGALDRVLRWTIPPAVLVSILTLDQAMGLTGLLDGLGVQASSSRLAVTATLGNPGDIGAFLVLPCLVAVSDVGEGRAPRWWRWIALAVMAAAMVATATLTALAALVVGASAYALAWSGTRWRQLLTSRAAARTSVAVIMLLVAAMATPPLRARLSRGREAVAARDLNAVLTGRLDGWRVAAYMLETHPITGVGQGGFVPEFAAARLALMDRGTSFYPAQTQTIFATPHNEVLSVGAEQGWPGIVAVLWGVCCLVRAAWWTPGRRRPLAWGGLAAVAVLSATWFPFHAAAVAWPWLAWIAWLDRAARDEEPA